jgi:hypothetical protein
VELNIPYLFMVHGVRRILPYLIMVYGVRRIKFTSIQKHVFLLLTGDATKNCVKVSVARDLVTQSLTAIMVL